MATGIKAWSTTAADNDNADSNINWLENQAPSTVNNSARAMMKAIRDQYEQTEWRDWGHTVTQASTTTFTIAADVTSIYTAGRAIKCVDSSTLYGFVTASSYSAPDTTVTVALDSGSLSGSLTSVELGPETTSPSISPWAIKWGDGANVASATDCNIWSLKDGHLVHVTGTTTITDWGTAPAAGSYMWVIFDGACQLTHNATTNDLNNNGDNFTTEAGDMALIYARSASSYKVTIFPYDGEAPQGGATVLSVIKQAQESVTSSTTLQNDDELVLTLAANTIYQFEAVIGFTKAASGPDAKFAFIEADGTYAFSVIQTIDSGSTSATLIAGVNEDVASINFSISSGAGDITYAHFKGTIKTGGSGGNFQFQWAPQTSTANALYVEANSWMKATKIGTAV